MAGYIGGSPVSGCEAAAREADVVVAAGCVRNSLERLEETVARLIVRLEPVLGPESPVGCDKASARGNCSLSVEMYSASERMDSATYRLRDVLDRLEV